MHFLTVILANITFTHKLILMNSNVVEMDGLCFQGGP